MSESISAPADDGAHAVELRAEFPGWDIGAKATGAHVLWRASRDEGRAGPMSLVADTPVGLRILLDEVDEIDCRHAVYELRDALRARGLAAEAQALTVATKTRTGIVRTVGARRGKYWWGSGVELAPIGDPDAAVDRMLPGLGLA